MGPCRGRAVRHAGTGVFVFELPAPVAAPGLDLARVGKWLERVAELRLDGARPTSKELHTGWRRSGCVPGRAVRRQLAGLRRGADPRSEDGARRPAARVVRLLAPLPAPAPRCARVVGRHRCPEEYEDALLDAFAAGVPSAERAPLPDPAVVLPWAVLRSPAGLRKATGSPTPCCRGQGPEPPPVSRIVDLPPAEADGARDEAKRGRRPAPGRGAGRVASAAAYAAQGSPRKAPEPIYLSPEGHDRLEAELAALHAERPDVIKRIATAREHGDLKENAEYHAAREEQGFLRGPDPGPGAKLKVAGRAAPTERGAQVELGSRVRVEVDGEESVIQVVSSARRAPARADLLRVSRRGRADGAAGRRRGDDRHPGRWCALRGAGHR